MLDHSLGHRNGQVKINVTSALNDYEQEHEREDGQWLIRVKHNVSSSCLRFVEPFQ
jgi:hypothetical protein